MANEATSESDSMAELAWRTILATMEQRDTMEMFNAITGGENEAMGKSVKLALKAMFLAGYAAAFDDMRKFSNFAVQGAHRDLNRAKDSIEKIMDELFEQKKKAEAAP